MKKILAVLLLVPSLALAGRNGGGTYTLPAGNPVQTGNVITSTWANNTLNDIATELSDPLSRSGKGGMSASLQLASGSASSPGLSWTAETNSGFYRSSAGDFRLSIGALDAARYTASMAYLPSLTAIAATSLTLKGQAADGGSAVGVIIDNSNALANGTAKLLSVRANAVEQASIRSDGAALLNGSVYTGGSIYTTAGKELVDRYVNVTSNQAVAAAGSYTFTTQAYAADEAWEVEFVTFYSSVASATPTWSISSTQTVARWAWVPMHSTTVTWTGSANPAAPLTQAGPTGTLNNISSQRAIIKGGSPGGTLTLSMSAATNTITILPGSYVRLKRIY